MSGVLLVGLMAAMSFPAAAIAQDLEEQPIVSIDAEGLRRVQREAALAGIESKVGEPLDEDVVTRDLRTIWNSNFFRDVQAVAESAPGGVKLIFILDEKPSIREVRYEGYKKMSKDDIEEVVDIKPFTILNVDAIKKNVEKVRDAYVQKGHYLAEVGFRIDPVPDADDQVDVVFEIVENAKVMVRQVNIVGNKHLSDAMVKSVLVRTQEGDELSFLTRTGTFKEDFFRADLYQIQALYFDHGFLNAQVKEPNVTISPDRRFIYITIRVEEGERYRNGDIAFSGDVQLLDDEGNVLVDEAQLRNRVRVESGEYFSRSKLLEDVQAITDVYRDHGYAFANVTPHTGIREDRTVDLDMEVERGDLVHIERIEIVGNTRTRDKVIRREMRVFEGETYSSSAINESRARIYQLGFFENVNIATNRGSGPDKMNVTVEVKEQSTGTFQIGAGFSTFENFIATAQISQNNFLGNGWLLSLSAQLSFGGPFARQLVTFQFFDPYFLDSRWFLGFDAYITQRWFRDFQRNSKGVSPRVGYPITDDLRLSLGYTLEHLAITTDMMFGFQGTQPALFNLERDGINSVVNASLMYDTRDNRLFPMSGHFHNLMMEVSHPYLGTSDGLSYCRAQAFLRYYHPLPLGFVVKTNATFGYVFCGGELGVPISERFFPGGIFSMRGFELRGLGPTVSVLDRGDPLSGTTEFIIGGNKQAIFNLELEFPILEAAGIRGVIFADAGNAYNDDQNMFFINTPDRLRQRGYFIGTEDPIDLPLGMYYSVGFGFRWFSPMGPLRFEWGIPITKRAPGDRNIVFEFTIGNFF